MVPSDFEPSGAASPPPTRGAVTRILTAVSRGERNASADLLPLVYDELRRLAAARMARLPPGQTVQPTELVHDAWLRLVGSEEVGWSDRGHFFAAAAIAMREILVERARKRSRLRHGGAAKRVELDESVPGDESDPDRFLALDVALNRLAEHDPRRHQLVMLRYFAGLTVGEAAACLGTSEATVKRDWNYAKAWLHDALANESGGAAGTREPPRDGD